MDVFIDPRFESIFERDPLVLADVGARGGLRPNWMSARRHLRLLGFEPDKEEHRRLVAKSAASGAAETYFDVALHNARERLHLYVARDRGLTSIFEPNRPFLDSFPDASRFDTVARQDVEADTLDHVLDGQGRGTVSVDFIKVDTQGSELFVLQGGANALTTSILGVEVESEFAPVYKGQPLFSDVDRYLQGRGFLLFDLRPCYWKRADGHHAGGPYGQIIWADALYLKSVRALRESLAMLAPERRRSTVLKAISISLLYGYVDYAIEIAAAPDLWDETDRVIVQERLRAATRSGAASFPGRRTLTAVLRRLWRWSQPPAEGWSVSDPDLGNPDS